MPHRTLALLLIVCLFASPLLAEQANTSLSRDMPQDYQIVPGDGLDVSVWKEDGMNSKLLVRPDGGITFPLIGELNAAGMTVGQLRGELVKRLGGLISEPDVTVSVVSCNQKIYVLGKVNKPGDFPMFNRISVMQALAMAGGLTPFADRDDVKVLRQTGNHTETFAFDYDEASQGEALEQNILLINGDTAVVP
jgi:polysaccharide export outer membrane protein